jgi:hypothetical protein
MRFALLVALLPLSCGLGTPGAWRTASPSDPEVVRAAQAITPPG